MTVASDHVGNPRTSNGVVGMGAYETAPAKPPSPTLRIFATTSNTVIVAWPVSATGYMLEQSSQMSGAYWAPSDVSPSVVNEENQVNVTPAVGTMFYRLRHP